MAIKLSRYSQDFFSKKVAPQLLGCKKRPAQFAMMAACAETVEKGGVLLAEAGTGTGKTFAYLIPLILSGKQAIISTKTINLQSQLYSKDLAFLAGIKPFDYAIAKGRSNYLCLRRFAAFQSESAQEQAEHTQLSTWASATRTGDQEDLVGRKPSIWEKICSDPDACKNLKCAYYGQCFYYIAKRKRDKAQIIVANHSLIAISGKMKEGKILPKADVLVVDEGHTLDSVLSDNIGTTISNTRFDTIMNKFLNFDEDNVPKGLLSASPHLFEAVESLRFEISSVWKILRGHHKAMELIGNLKGKKVLMKSSLSIKSLIVNIRRETMGLFKEDQEIELGASIRRLERFADDLTAFCRKADDLVRWMEINGDKTVFRLAPLYPGDFINKKIVPRYKSLILTSATLSVANDFSYTAGILGLENSRTISLSSPYNMRQQVSPKLKRGIDLDTDEGIRKLAETVVNEARKKDGGVLVLFTSRGIMRKTWDLCFEDLKKNGLRPMMQGEMSQNALVTAMRGSTNSVLFGLDAFWEGVDIRGDSLKCLVITKLPFEVPNTPMVKARMHDVESNGKNPFYEYLLPRAILKFKQGFGRLIRSESDTGRVIVCDERLKTEKYGSNFIKSVLS